MADPTTKAALVAQMRAAQQAAETTIAHVPPAKFAEPGVNGDWSAKDEVAHLTFWNEILLSRLAAAAANNAPDAAAMPTTDAEIDEWNARCFAAHRDQPLDAVLAEFRDAYTRVERAVNGLSETDLFDGNRFAWTRGRPLWRSVADNCRRRIASAPPRRSFVRHLNSLLPLSAAPAPHVPASATTAL